ncbi:MAG: hypothetical protein ABIK84_01180 [candidate division WOR-3 bacterium]
MEKEKLKQFLELLQRIKHPQKRTFDLGLVVKESKSEVKSDEVFKEIQKEIKIEKVVYDEKVFDDDVIEQIINLFKDKKWVFLEIRKDIKSPLLNQLKHLANYNSFQLIDYKGQDVFEMKMPEESRLIVFAERDFIENKISYPYFYTLFGPILSI